MGQDIKPVLANVSKNRLDNDLIYVYHGAKPAFLFYAPSYGLTENYIIGVNSIEDPIKYLEEIDNLERGHRIWFIFSNNCSGCVVNEEVYIVEHLDKMGRKLDEIQAAGASGYLYEIGQIR